MLRIFPSSALLLLSPHGVIMMHDCNPRGYEMQLVPRGETESWTGDVWRAAVALRQVPGIEIVVGEFVGDI